MNLLKTIIERLNQRVEVANIFDKQFGLCELNANGNDKAWVHYIGNGQAEVVTNFDAKNGTLFWAKRGKVTVNKTDAYKMSGCKQLYVTSFPLTAYAVVRKSHLPCDSEDAQDWIASRVYKLTSGTDPLFKQSIAVINYEVVPTGYTNEIKTLTAHYEWACVSIDFDVQVITTTEDGCYDICATGDVPLPDLPACTPCLTEVAVDGITIIGNGTAADPLVAIGGGGEGLKIAIAFSTDHQSITGNQYQIGNVVWYNGNIYRCLAANDSIVPTNATYWTNLGPGFQTIERPSDWNATTGNNQILNKPTIPTLTSELTNDSGFITSGDIPPQVNSDWNATTGVEEILNKPTIPDAQVNSDWNSTSGLSEILNKPTIPTTTSELTNDSGFITSADVPTLTSELTNDSGFITIGDVPTQVNSDWNATSGFAEILNKPTIPILPATIVESVSGTAPIASSGGANTDISITKADGSTDGYLTSTDWSTFNGKFDVPTGTNTDYLDGTGAPTSFPTIPTATSELTNDSGFITIGDVPTQVNSDWNATSGFAEILNKPSIPAAQIQSDWTQSNNAALDYIKNKPTLTNGTVTSVNLTMPSAFAVTGNPVTSSGTLAVAGAGLSSQYIRGDGQLANFPTSSGGGSSLNYYLNGSVAQGTLGGVAFKQMSSTPVIGGGTDFTINADGYIQSFITDASVPNQLLIPAGNWNFEMYFSSSSAGGTPRFYIELYKLSAGTLTLLASNSATPEGITNGTAIDLYTTAVAVPSTVLLAADRLAVRVYVIHSSKTITLHTEDNHLCQVITTFSTGLTALNGLTAQVQNLAVGTSGTDFAISSSTDTHTFNLPTASASNRGALSAADWSTFNSKGSGTITSVTGTAPIASSGGLTPAISIADAAADGTTKGAATFTAADFNATAGVVSIDYTNGQAASASAKGFLTSADWTTFNGKQATITPAALTKTDDTNVTLTLGGSPTTALLQGASITAGWSGTLADARITSAATWNAKQSAITLTTTGTSGAATLTGATLNIPQYAVSTNYKSVTDSASFSSVLNTAVYTQLIPANTFVIGDIIRISYRTRKTGALGVQTIRIYVNATADLSGTPMLVSTWQTSGGATLLTSQMLRHWVIKNATTNTETLNSAFNGFSSDIGSTYSVLANAIDWTANRYIVFAIQNSNATDVNFGSMYLIEKL